MDLGNTAKLLRDNRITYIVIGDLERAIYPQLRQDLLTSWLPTAFETSSTKVLRFDPGVAIPTPIPESVTVNATPEPSLQELVREDPPAATSETLTSESQSTASILSE
jgi:hypothetical protein